jgi:hypothetical protein
VPAWYVAPLEMNEGTPWGQGYNKSTRLQCRKRPKYRLLPLPFTLWHGRGMASVNQTRPHCVNLMGKTHSKPLAARHGRGTAWARHAMCESAFTVLTSTYHHKRLAFVCEFQLEEIFPRFRIQ